MRLGSPVTKAVGSGYSSDSSSSLGISICCGCSPKRTKDQKKKKKQAIADSSERWRKERLLSIIVLKSMTLGKRMSCYVVYHTVL